MAMAMQIFAILAASGLAIASAPAVNNTRSAKVMPARVVPDVAVKPVGSSCFVQQSAGRKADVVKSACRAQLAADGRVAVASTGARTAAQTAVSALPSAVVATAAVVSVSEALEDSNSSD